MYQNTDYGFYIKRSKSLWIFLTL